MSRTETILDRIDREHPEWGPWLATISEAQRECASGAWLAVVPERPTASPALPDLSGATVVLPEKIAGRFLERLADTASRGGTEKMTQVRAALRGDVDLAGLFHASLTQDERRVSEFAAAADADAEALQAVVTLLAVPFLHACRTAWASPAARTWTEGYCPLCGSWPAFAELRGIERSRYHRCGRCGSEWHAQPLQCAFCRTMEHEQLASLVPARSDGIGTLDACKRCLGYLKVFTRLQGSAPTDVMLEDLGSVALDLAALDAGYQRPSGAACPPAVTVNAQARNRLLAWGASALRATRSEPA